MPVAFEVFGIIESGFLFKRQPNILAAGRFTILRLTRMTLPNKGE